MQKYYLILLLFIGFQSFSIQAQHCSSHERLLEDLAKNPEMRANLEALETETQAYISQNRHAKKVQATKVIPVVFHVIHSGGSENISVAQIRNQVDILNAEFNRLFADTVKTPAPFKPLAGSLAVEFRLATKDPDGNCTQGITRTFHPFTNCSPNEEDPKALAYWPSNKYLNVWLVTSMHYAGQTGCGGGGYAQFPGGNAKTDGINIRADLIGSIGTATTNSGWGNFLGRYLIHELGHWLNLRHIWGDASCGNDLVSDTPIHQTSNSGCPSFPWRANNTCGSDADGEMFTNYMDYTNGPCLNMFSKEQVLRMEACLNSSISNRNNLWSTANLIATGTQTVSFPDCPAVPEIIPYTSRSICKGGSVTFRAASYGGTTTSRTWSFEGGSASSTTDSIVTVTYNTPGVYAVTLTNQNANGTRTKTFYDKVAVSDPDLPQPIVTNPFTDSFENNPLENGWQRTNIQADTTWQHTGIASFTGLRCVRINNFRNNIGGIDELISPRLDLSSFSAATLRFRLSFAARNTSCKDRLVVQFSNNCGQTWTGAYNKMANSATASQELKTLTNVVSNAYIPNDETDWRQESITIPSAFRNANTQVKFIFTSSGGNNLYLDDVNISGTQVVSVQENTEQTQPTVYPNPAHDFIVVDGTEEGAKLEIVDAPGRTVLSTHLERAQSISIGHLKAGIYIWKIESKTGFKTGKLCIE